MKILLTGSAGFIGFHLAQLLIKENYEVVGLDSINAYYDINLKYGRLKECGIQQEEITYGKIIQSTTYNNYRFIQLQLEDKAALEKLFAEEKFTHVCNLAAQAGVRYSLENPDAYISSNVTGFMHLLECCRHNNIQHLVYASTSSVYGLNTAMPLSEHMAADHPMTLYAATKKANEMMAHSYSHLFQLPTTGLRFFTVYGPWGRPDMALFLFTDAILNDKPINVFNYGNMVRDFTYVADIVESVKRCIFKPAIANENWDSNTPDPSSSSAPYRIFNIGNSTPVKLNTYIEAVEKALDKKAIQNLLPMQLGDVPETNADVNELIQHVNYKPATSVEDGVKNFIDWYNTYYGI
ncbi:MAG: NAD-dependent epimerase [Bacteroidetes bacterium]|nr:NAD-dependent epimerase [Bacteroidota bacterium]